MRNEEKWKNYDRLNCIQKN